MSLRSCTEALKKALCDCCLWGLVKSCTGSIAMPLAIAAPAFMAAVAVASDMAVFSMKRSELQAAADSAAIAAANELALGKKNQSVLDASAENFVAAAIDDSSITVQVREDWTPFFAHFIGVDVTPVIMTATAALAGESNLCIIALSSSMKGALHLDNTAAIMATGCTVYSDSLNPKGIEVKNNGVIDSPLVCSAGGIDLKKKSSVPGAQTDCPTIPDPLAGRTEPTVAGCDHNNLVIKSGTVTMSPGTYCGGLKLKSNVEASFEPGVYIISNGELEISGSAKATGTDLAFFLTGKNASINFSEKAEISFSGAENGSLAGLLFFESAKSPSETKHVIRADGVKELTGTIYLPKGDLLIDPTASVGEKSAYTALVVNSLDVQKGPKLVLNTDYADTKVPVPVGIQTVSQVILTK
jgi:Flp pilus assembly protein TadG